MNSSKLKGIRVEKGKTQKNMAELIGKSLVTYSKKERGEVEFSNEEMPTPLKYNPAYHDDWAWSLAIKGATDQDIADAFHVSRRTIIRWRQTYPSFNEACQHGKEVADAKVKRSLYERAVGFEYQEKESVIDVDPRTGEQKPVRVRTLTKKAVPDTMAQMYWLNNRCRDEFSQTQKVTLDGAVQTSPFDNLTDDELRRLAQMDEGLDGDAE